MIKEILIALTVATSLVVAPSALAEVAPGADSLLLEGETSIGIDFSANSPELAEAEVVTPVAAEPKQVTEDSIEGPTTEWDASEWTVVEESETLTVNPTLALTAVEPVAPVVEESEPVVAVVEPTPTASEQVEAHVVVEPEAPTVAQNPAVEPASTPQFFGTDGDSTGGKVSASVFVEPDTVVDRQQAGLTVDGVTVDVFRQGVNVTEDNGHYSSEEFGGSVSVEVHRDEDVAVRVRGYGGTINENWSGDDGWSGDGHTTYVGAAVDAEVAINDQGGVVTGSIGVKNSRGQTIGSEDFNRTSPTVNLAVDTPISADGRTRLYAGGGYDETPYADLSVNYDVLAAENQSLALGAFASYRNGEPQLGPEVAYTVGDQDQAGLYARVAARLNALEFTPQLAAEVVWNF